MGSSGINAKYIQLKEKYDKKFNSAALNYIERNVTELKKSNPSRAYTVLKQMGAPPGTCDDQGSFTLQNHREQNLTSEQSSEKIAQYFAQISQEYPHLDINSLPKR